MGSRSAWKTCVFKVLWPVATVLVIASPCLSRAALTPSEATCRQRVGSVGRGLLRDLQKAITKCRDRVSKGALPTMTDCSVEPGTASRITKVEGQVGGKIAAACSDAVVAQLVFGGACYGSGTAADLASCLVDTHEEQAFALADVVYGSTGLLPAAQQACQAAVSKQGKKFVVKRHKQITHCKDLVGRGTLAPTTDCGAEAATVVNRSAANAATKIAAKCLAFGKPCIGVTTAAALGACTLGQHADRDETLIAVEYGSGASGTTALAKQISIPSSECVKGPLSRCRAGDYLLANDRIRVVVQDLQRNLFGIGQFGGQIIDADLVRIPPDPERDNFEEWSTSINIENTAHYTALQILNDGSDGQAAVIRATGVDDLLDFINPSTVVAAFGFPFPAAANDTDLPVEVMTDYVLEPGRNWVRVETTVHNTGATPLSIYFGEFLNGSGQVEQFQSAYGFGEPTVTLRCPAGAANPCNTIVYAGVQQGAGVSYGYTNEDPDSSAFSTAGVAVPLIGTEVVLAVIGAASPPWTMATNGTPGDAITFTRYFIVGDGSVSSVLDARNQALGLATGRLEGNVTAGGVPTAGVQMTVLGSGSEAPAGLTRNVVTQALTDANGHYALTIPPGSYTVAANLDGSPFEASSPTPVEHPIAIAAYATTTQDVALPATGTLVVNLVDELGAPLAGKASVVGFDPSPGPRNTQSVFGLINLNTGIFGDFGPDELPFGLAQTLFFDQHGTSGPVSLEPGSYRVVVSHGPEYSIAAQDVTLTPGATTTVNAQVARVVDSTGFVASDFHVHSIESPDSNVSRRDRVVTMLAEGVDFFTPSDHDIRTDYAPDVAALGASNLISTAVSAEITTFDYGHFNAWPATIDPGQVNGGSVDHGGAAPAGQDFPAFGNYNLTPGQIMAAAAADPTVNTVQINHIHSFFSIDGNSGLAIDTGVVPPQSAVPGAARRLNPAIPNYFDAGFNALEVWIGDDRGQVYTNFLGQNAGDWFNLINQGIVRPGVADSDTHVKVTGQAGIPRTMVASPTDDPAALAAIAPSLSQNVNDGRTFGTNAPILRVTSSAASTGQTGGLALGLPTLISTTDGAVSIHVDVESPVWAPFDKVEFYVNSTTTRTASMKESGAGMVSVKRYGITPDYVQTVSPTLVTVNGAIPGAQRLEASTTLDLTGLTHDAWVVVMVKGTDGVSRPLFPVIPDSLKRSTNNTLADLTDGNLGEDGMTALAFSNPLYVDVDGGGWTAPGLQIVP
jgi:hypothetical protein